MSRRSKGEGAIYRRSDGKWCAAIVHDDPATLRRRRTVLYGRTRTEVSRKLKEAQKRVEAGGPVRDATTSLAAWLQYWQDTSLESSSRKETTKQLYKSVTVHHLSPEPFGALRLDQLKPTHVEALLGRLRDKRLSESTVRQAFIVLGIALDAAVRDGLLARNPTRAVHRPSIASKEAEHMTPDEVASILAAAASSRYYPLFALLVATGLRRGEAAALKWTDVDLKHETLKVRGTLVRINAALVITPPKSEKSRREVPLSPGVVKMLKAHRSAQNHERLRAGNQWIPSGHVFVTEFGAPVDPRNILRAFRTAANAAKIDHHVTVHTLRHSAATGWLENGLNIVEVSRRLGHSSISITGDVYGHISDAAARGPMDAWSEAIGL